MVLKIDFCRSFLITKLNELSKLRAKSPSRVSLDYYNFNLFHCLSSHKMLEQLIHSCIYTIFNFIKKRENEASTNSAEWKHIADTPENKNPISNTLQYIRVRQTMYLKLRQ